ncbi:anti-sigma factor [Maribius pontilimi]|uniref:Regulator of SigK n=1 Tax=Palleronia pontilimi TaxID=1964209 RepID=A0A934IE55_9RHOB|nr:anti-sigma factor [Palleronia pontilimi]MBJ3762787.1 anti-sigma factor [Palleronia pontilimi]
MSKHDITPGTPDADALAAEYVLHLLDPEERARVEALLDVDGAWRGRVADWSERLGLMADEIDPVTPPAHLRARVERLVAEDRAAGTDKPRARRSGWLQALLGGGVAATLAVLLLMVALPRIQPPDSGPLYAADVATADQALLVEAHYDPDAAQLTITRVAGSAPPGRDLQMWLLTEDQPPHSVGILPEDGTLSIPVIPFWGQRIPTGRFAISEEPPGGSTDEIGPTGTVLAVGEVQEI